MDSQQDSQDTDAGSKSDQDIFTTPPTNARKRRRSASGGSYRADSPTSRVDHTIAVNPRKKRTANQPAPLLYVANVEETAVRVSGSTADLGDTTLLRIQKMLSRADQHGANQNEAKIALRRAEQLMRRLNISRAEVLAHNPDDRQDFAGHSIVTLRRSDGHPMLPVRLNCWVQNLAHAMGLFFAVKSFSTKTWFSEQRLNFIFYGFAESTVTAAHAFVMVFNLLGSWAQKYKGVSRRNSYCRGVCRALQDLAKSEKEEEERALKKAEAEKQAIRVEQDEAERQAELERLKNPYVEPYTSDSDGRDSGLAARDSIRDYRDSPYSPQDTLGAREPLDGDASDADGDEGGDLHDSDDDDSADDNEVDTEEQGIQNLLTCILSPTPKSTASTDPPTTAKVPGHRSPAPPTGEIPVLEEVPRWDSHTALIAYRHQADKVADDWAKDNGLDLEYYRKNKAKPFNLAAYNSDWRVNFTTVFLRFLLFPSSRSRRFEGLSGLTGAVT